MLMAELSFPGLGLPSEGAQHDLRIAAIGVVTSEREGFGTVFGECQVAFEDSAESRRHGRCRPDDQCRRSGRGVVDRVVRCGGGGVDGETAELLVAAVEIDLCGEGAGTHRQEARHRQAVVSVIKAQGADHDGRITEISVRTGQGHDAGEIGGPDDQAVRVFAAVNDSADFERGPRGRTETGDGSTDGDGSRPLVDAAGTGEGSEIIANAFEQDGFAFDEDASLEFNPCIARCPIGASIHFTPKGGVSKSLRVLDAQGSGIH